MQDNCSLTEKKEEIREVNKIIETQSRLNEQSESYRLGDYHDAPDYLRDNEYIKTGYRINYKKIPHILKSLFEQHNEFVNVWTHLIGTFFMIALVVYTAIFINNHRNDLFSEFENINSKINLNFTKELGAFSRYSSEITHNLTDEVFSGYEKSKQYFGLYKDLLKNKTIQYFVTMDEKMKEYKDYVINSEY